jgi:nitroreductase
MDESGSMETYKTILTKLDIRRFSSKKIPGELILKILEAARSAGTAFNAQNWKFILVQEASRLMQLAKDSTRGQWVEDASLAIIVLTDPREPDHGLDGGRAVQNMQLAAWGFGVGSGLFTILNEDAMRRDFKIPKKMHIAAVVVFGYPERKISGERKNRKPLSEIVHLDEYGRGFDSKGLS